MDVEESDTEEDVGIVDLDLVHDELGSDTSDIRSFMYRRTSAGPPDGSSLHRSSEPRDLAAAEEHGSSGRNTQHERAPQSPAPSRNVLNSPSVAEEATAPSSSLRLDSLPPDHGDGAGETDPGASDPPRVFPSPAPAPPDAAWPGPPQRPARDYRWDSAHLRFPCARENVIVSPSGRELWRWARTVATLRAAFSGPGGGAVGRGGLPAPTQDGGSGDGGADPYGCSGLGRDAARARMLAHVVRSVGPPSARRWNLHGLERFAAVSLSREDRDALFEGVLPRVAQLAASIEDVFASTDIALLRSGKRGECRLSPIQAACLVSQMFFCTLPRRTRSGERRTEYARYPTVHFAGLYVGAAPESPGSPAPWAGPGNPVSEAKLVCFLRYLDAATDPGGPVMGPGHPGRDLVLSRRVYRPGRVDWRRATEPLTQLEVKVDGTLEDDAPGCWHADFANKVLGGGVLGHGAVQEEILFALRPALLVTRLVCEKLGDSEAIVASGAARYSRHEGYSWSFRYAGPYPTPGSAEEVARAAGAERVETVFAIDAIHFRRGCEVEQFRPEYIERELDKALAGFNPVGHSERAERLATGNWGCGAFNGDLELKALIQVVAAAVARRPLLYFTYGNAELASGLARVHAKCARHGIPSGRLASWLFDYEAELLCGRAAASRGVFSFVESHLGT